MRLKYKYIHAWVDKRNGQRQAAILFPASVGTKQVALPGLAGSAEFKEAYAAAPADTTLPYNLDRRQAHPRRHRSMRWSSPISIPDFSVAVGLDAGDLSPDPRGFHPRTRGQAAGAAHPQAHRSHAGPQDENASGRKSLAAPDQDADALRGAARSSAPTIRAATSTTSSARWPVSYLERGRDRPVRGAPSDRRQGPAGASAAASTLRSGVPTS